MGHRCLSAVDAIHENMDVVVALDGALRYVEPNEVNLLLSRSPERVLALLVVASHMRSEPCSLLREVGRGRKSSFYSQARADHFMDLTWWEAARKLQQKNGCKGCLGAILIPRGRVFRSQGHGERPGVGQLRVLELAFAYFRTPRGFATAKALAWSCGGADGDLQQTHLLLDQLLNVE